MKFWYLDASNHWPRLAIGAEKFPGWVTAFDENFRAVGELPQTNFCPSHPSKKKRTASRKKCFLVISFVVS
jgi:hypothetical protein